MQSNFFFSFCLVSKGTNAWVMKNKDDKMLLVWYWQLVFQAKGKICEAIILILTALTALFSRGLSLLITVISVSFWWLTEWVDVLSISAPLRSVSEAQAGWLLLLNSSRNTNLMGMEHDLSRSFSTEASCGDKGRTCFAVLLVKCRLGRVWREPQWKEKMCDYSH